MAAVYHGRMLAASLGEDRRPEPIDRGRVILYLVIAQKAGRAASKSALK